MMKRKGTVPVLFITAWRTAITHTQLLAGEATNPSYPEGRLNWEKPMFLCCYGLCHMHMHDRHRPCTKMMTHHINRISLNTVIHMVTLGSDMVCTVDSISNNMLLPRAGPAFSSLL